MKTLATVLTTIALGSLTLVGLSRSAHAVELDLSACGDINIEANVGCKIEVGGGCKTMCEPLRFVTVCTTKRYKVCKKQCTIKPPTVSCTGSCQAGCDAKCKVDPPSFSCQASCQGSCKADCESYCGTAGSQTDCTASCKATCSTECSASCKAQAPSAACTAKCSASCSGSCSITAPYIACQVKCQEVAVPDCETTLKGGCETECQKPEGALFCDGQYIDHGGKLRECIDSLNTFLDSLVNVSASGSLTSDCNDGVCSITLEVGCGVAGDDSPNGPVMFGIFTLLGAIVLVSSRRRS
jgi:MYXO-CTERM domain-containing protein